MPLFLLPFSRHVVADEHQQFWSDGHCPGLLRASFMPVVCMCSLAWQARSSRSGGGKGRKVWSLRGVKGSHLSTSVTDLRSSPPYTSMLRLPLCSRFDTLCSCLLYYEEETWRGTQQNRFYTKLLQLQVEVKNRISVAHLTGLTEKLQSGFLLSRPWTFWHG